MLNTFNISYAKKDAALTDIVTILFNMQNADDTSFRLSKYFGAYKLFFASTLWYESLGISTRMKATEWLET